MLYDLMRRADEIRSRLYELMSPLVERRVVQGALLDVDRRWLAWYVTHHFGLRRFYDWWLPQFDGELSAGDIVGWYYELDDPISFDVNVRPDWWGEHCVNSKLPEHASPLRIRIVLRIVAPRHANANFEFPREFEGIPITYEVRPPVVAASGFGFSALRRMFLRGGGLGDDDMRDAGLRRSLSVGKNLPSPSAGTIGGFLRDATSGERFVLGCAHALGGMGTTIYTPGPFENDGMSEIGQVVWAEIPDVRVDSVGCNLFAAPLAGRLDAALVRLASDHEALAAASAGLRISAIFPPQAMCPTQAVEWLGKVSGRRQARLGAPTIWHELQFPDGVRCFGQLIEITARSEREPWVQPGDSGACLSSSLGSERRWVGNVIASQRDRAYACVGKTTIDAIRAAGWWGIGLDA